MQDERALTSKVLPLENALDDSWSNPRSSVDPASW
jgi:hypothetical protein